jgi:hypothetical protein
MAIALNQDIKPSTKSTNLHWIKWSVAFSLLAVFDAAMIIQQ